MAANQDDELLSILLINLRNAAATFGEGTPPYESIRTTVEEHVKAMNARGSHTNVTSIRGSSGNDRNQNSQHDSVEALNTSFGNLAFRPKPSNS